ncbi:MAG: glycosyltransferase [Pseudomonadales bacterium]|nr:glycosyltransferase [Pseudomonadales bacterium]
MKNKKVIVIPFTLPWDWSADFQRQTCLELARKNIQVFAYMSDDSYFFIKNKKRHYPKIKNVSFYVPRYYVPLRRFKIIEELNKYLSLIIFTCKIFSKKKIVWIFDPQFHYFPKFFKNSKSLYDCVDFFGIEHESDENKLINNTDMLFVNSHTLLSFHKNKIKNIFLVPQGFNSSEFNKNIKLIKKSKNNKKPIIGYAGGINYRIDYKLLIKLISRNPQWNFSFWGPIQECQKEKLKDILRQIKKLKQFSNVQFSSTKNKLKLMNAINSFDVCIIPYDIKQSFNLNSYPMKVFEYFYLGKPVISTKISELKLEKFKDLIFTSNNSKSWEKKIKNILDSPWPAKLKNKQRTLAIENSWENKVNKILEIII